MPNAPLRVFANPEAIGEELATRLLGRIERARIAGQQYLLGCPTGRSPRPVYAAMGHRLAASPQPLSHLLLVMMDEYLVPAGDALTYAPAHAPWSCHHFARVEIAAVLNQGLPPSHRISEDGIWFPDPRDPEEYEARIDDAGGLDCFILASGASDGHVAFNPPGSARDSRTRIIELSDETRRDNLKTFPTFGSLDAVPRHGISVGVETITRAREAVMLAWGEGKRLTVARRRRASRYDADWPATLIHECAGGELFCDSAAAAEAAEPTARA